MAETPPWRVCENLLPRAGRERVALQTHIPLPRDFGEHVVLQFLPEGYSGQAPTGNGELNVCLVGKPNSIAQLKTWAEREFGIERDHSWRTITPLTRRALSSTEEKLFLVGDVARVVEPFTGEGIFYALRSGELAAQSIVKIITGANEERIRCEYEGALHSMYSRSLVAQPFGALGRFVPETRIQIRVARAIATGDSAIANEQGCSLGHGRLSPCSTSTSRSSSVRRRPEQE